MTMGEGQNLGLHLYTGVIWPNYQSSLRYQKKLSCCCNSRSYCVRRTLYWQTIKPVSVARLWTGWLYARSGSRV